MSECVVGFCQVDTNLAEIGRGKPNCDNLSVRWAFRKICGGILLINSPTKDLMYSIMSMLSNIV